MTLNKKMVNHIIQNDGMSIDGDEAWFVDRTENVLYKWDLKTEICNFITTIPIQRKNGFRNNSICLKCDDEIFLFPDAGTSIWIYNIVTENFLNIPINNPDHLRIGAIGCWREKENIWVTALGLKEIWRISIAEKKIITVYKIFENMEIECGSAIDLIDDKLYIGAVNTGILCEFCISTEEIRYEKIKGLEDGVNTICCDGERIWFSGKSNKLIGWKRATDDFIEIIIPPCFIKKNESGESVKEIEKTLFHQSIYDGERIWFFPWKFKNSRLVCKNVLYFDCNSCEVKALQVYGHEAEGIVSSLYMLQGKYMNISYDGGDAALFEELDLKTFALHEKHMYRIYQDVSKSLREMILSRGSVQEYSAMDLEAFIENCNVKQEWAQREMGNVGSRIYEYNAH